MKSIRSLVLLFALALPIVACGSGQPPASPAEVTIAFAEAFNVGNIDIAMSHLSAEVDAMGREKVRGGLAQMVNDVRRMGATSDSKDEFEVVDETIDGHIARVSFRAYGEGGSITHEFVLMLENGEWKISLADTFPDLL